ncbi:MAG TPA: membrane protein insertase YidC [Burkholderiaceae bacterium]|nr:membrane protein insertase YidC [Burkholderiaceae bacterium]
MTDIRRTLLWVVFVMSLVLLWDAWNKHTGAPSMFGGAPARPHTSASAPHVPGADGAGAVPSTVPSATTSVPTTGAAPTAVVAPSAATTATGVELVTLTTDLVKATIDSRGGELMHLELLQQHDQFDRSRNVVLFDRSASRIYLARTGLATIDGVAYPNHETPYRVLPGPRELQPGGDTVELKLESPVINGVQVRKTYTFKRGDYRIAVRHEVISSADKPLSPQLYLQLVRDGNPPPGESSFYFTFTGPAMYTDAKKFEKIDFKDIEKGKTDHDRSANDGWIAMVQHYFASAWLIGDGPRDYVTAKLGDNLYSVAMIVKLGALAPGATLTQQATLYAGPQEEKKLEAMAPGLELVKDYGHFAILAKPLFWLLDQLHRVFGNWGWSIVALVVLLKIAFYWLNASAYRSMAKMKAINPKVMEMRERLKEKPQQMQQEMMRIYREEKVNPLGGCLPIVVQIPFFIALYWVLLSSVEMRNAPWIGWIHDLSTKDPFYILPLLMTGSTLFQTWLNPTPPDPVQAKMMWIMPLVFSVMFFVFPAGLVLYWLTNNLLSIAQQWFINKRLGVAQSLIKK